MKFSIVACLLAALVVTGCSKSSIVPPSTEPVSGTVTYKGKGLAGVRVKFHPQFDIGKVKFIPNGETGPGGKFTLSTGEGGNGAPRGEYIVTMEYPQIQSNRKDGNLETEVDAWQGKYSDPATSKWKITIKPGENVLEPFALD